MSETKHSVVMGGSSAERRINCPGSLHAEAGLPDQPSPYAAEGTACHEAMERLLVDWEDGDENRFERFYNWRATNGYVLDKEIVQEKIVPAWEAFLEVQKVVGAPEGAIILEPMLRIDDERFGSADAMWITDSGKTLVLLDWKFGSGIVDAEDNVQTMFYALCAMTDPNYAVIVSSVEKVVCVIVQPLAPEPWSADTHDRIAIVNFGAVVDEATRRARPLDAPRFAGSWCKWCKAKLTCREYAGDMFSAVDKKPAAMSPTEFAYYSGLLPKLKEWIKAFESARYDAMKTGVNIPGYKLVEGRAQRAWKSEAVVAATLKRAGVPPNVIFEASLRSPAQYEKLLKGSPALSMITPLIESKPSGLVVAPESDRRPAVSVSQQTLVDAFEGMTEGDSIDV